MVEINRTVVFGYLKGRSFFNSYPLTEAEGPRLDSASALLSLQKHFVFVDTVL